MKRNLFVSLVAAALLTQAALVPVSRAAAASPSFASPHWGTGHVVTIEQSSSFLTRLSQGIANAIRLPEAAR